MVRGVENAVQCEKCKIMHFCRDNKRYPYHMNNQVLEVVKEKKDLEVVFIDSIKVSGQYVYGSVQEGQPRSRNDW